MVSNPPQQRLLAGRALGLVLAAACLPGCGGDQAALSEVLAHTVQRRDLHITVRERGDLHAARDTRLYCELEGRNTLIYLIPEGTFAAEGDRLAEVDVSATEEKRSAEAIAVARVEAELDQARKNFEVMEKQLEADESTAASRLEVAQLRLQKFFGQARGAGAGAGAGAGTNAKMVADLRELLGTETSEGQGESKYAGLVDSVLDLFRSEDDLDLQMGELANQVLKQINEISLARSELIVAAETLEWSKKLADKGFLTKTELDQDRISHERRLSQTTLAWNDLELLILYTLPETRITTEQEVANAALDLESVRAINESTRVREAAKLKSSEAEFELAKGRLDDYADLISKAVIRAPTPGLVVHGRYDRDRTVYEGMTTWELLELVRLPDITSMIAELDVHEAQIDQVALGQLARVEVDAFPGQSFDARVSGVSALPKYSRGSNVKLYEVYVDIELDNVDGALRPGMNASVEVDVATLRDVLVVPQPALDRRGDDQYVWMATSGEPVARRVELGANNLTHVQVTHGLTEGERIWLVRPPGAVLPEEGDAPARGAAPEESGPEVRSALAGEDAPPSSDSGN